MPLPPRDPATGRFLPRASETPEHTALLARYEAELGDVPARLAKAADDGVSALIYAAVGAALFLIVAVIIAVAVGNAT